MPKTALGECGLDGVEITDPLKNLNCGASFLAKQLRRFNDVELALAAYNSGPERVAKLGRVPRITETQNYVNRIIADWNQSL
jgi:soluble lytic murein transglycosylase-like protein